MNGHNHTKDISEKKKAVHRIKIIQGHLKAIEKMLEEDKYCVDIVHQSMAVQKALKKLDLELIANHLKTCVVHQIRDGEEKKTVEELKKLYEMK